MSDDHTPGTAPEEAANDAAPDTLTTAQVVSTEPVDPPDDETTVDTDDDSDDDSDLDRDDEDERDDVHKHVARKHPLWQESLLLVGVALVLAVVVKALFLQLFYIPSPSMEPGLVKNDRILVEKPSYWRGTPQRGDVVVFDDPGGWLNEGEDAGPDNVLSKALAKVGLFPSGGHLVKRVVGVAGDTIVCCDTDGRISVNGKALDEDDYLLEDVAKDCNGPMTGNCAWTAGPVPDGKLFVMGDNRANSGDSSAHLCTAATTDCTQDPYVDVDSVTGKVMDIVWPLSHFGFLHRPGVFDDIPDPD